jgi:hypothetical protein
VHHFLHKDIGAFSKTATLFFDDTEDNLRARGFSADLA